MMEPCAALFEQPRAKLRLRPCRNGQATNESATFAGLAVSVEPTIHELPRTLEPPSQYLLWIDGVGGYLVCLSHRVTLGQANPESVVDIPLLADVSRHH